MMSRGGISDYLLKPRAKIRGDRRDNLPVIAVTHTETLFPKKKVRVNPDADLLPLLA